MTFLKPYIVTENKYLPDMIKTVMWNLSFHTSYKQEERKVIGFFFFAYDWKWPHVKIYISRVEDVTCFCHIYQNFRQKAAQTLNPNRLI